MLLSGKVTFWTQSYEGLLQIMFHFKKGDHLSFQPAVHFPGVCPRVFSNDFHIFRKDAKYLYCFLYLQIFSWNFANRFTQKMKLKKLVDFPNTVILGYLCWMLNIVESSISRRTWSPFLKLTAKAPANWGLFQGLLLLVLRRVVCSWFWGSECVDCKKHSNALPFLSHRPVS